MIHHRVSRSVWAALSVTCALALGACGSDEKDSGGSADSGTTVASQAVDPTKEYVPGVPPLAELYRGTEGTPPTSGPPIAKDKTVVFVSCGQAAPGCAGVPNEMAKPAKLVGWNYRVIDGRLNADNGWANGVRQAIAAKPDAIIVHGMNCPDVKQPLQEAVDAGIPVMGLENVDCDDELVDGGRGTPLFEAKMQYTDDIKSGADYYHAWGALQAQYIINATRGEAKIIRTNYQPIFGIHMKRGQDEALALCETCELVGEISYGVTDVGPSGPLFQKFNTVLGQQPDANAVLMGVDGVVTTAGVAKAIADAGRHEDIVSIGGEGYAPALQLIRENGGLNAESAHDGKWMAWGAVDNLNRFFNGEPPVPQGVGFRIVDKDNNMMPPGEDYATPVDYRTAYKKLWGV